MITCSLLRRSDVALLLGIRPSTVDYLVRLGRLARPIRLTNHDLRWDIDDVMTYLDRARADR